MSIPGGFPAASLEVFEMRRIKRTAVPLLAWFFFASLLFSRNLGQEENLPPKIRDFLKLTAYIILPQEKNVLLKL